MGCISEKAVGEKAIQVYLDLIGDLETEAFSLLSQFGQWIVFGIRADRSNPLPFESIRVMWDKINARGFNLYGYLPQVPQALSAVFKLAGEGTLKLEITEYPLK